MPETIQDIEKFILDAKAQGISADKALLFLEEEGRIAPSGAPPLPQDVIPGSPAARILGEKEAARTATPVTIEQAARGATPENLEAVFSEQELSAGKLGFTNVGAARIADFLGDAVEFISGADPTGLAAEITGEKVTVPTVERGQPAEIEVPRWRQGLAEMQHQAEGEFLDARFNTPSEIAQKELALFGFTVALDPLNALPVVGFSGDILRGMTVLGRKMLVPATLSAGDFAAAVAGGVAEDIAERTARLGASVEREMALNAAAKAGEEAAQRARDLTARLRFGGNPRLKALREITEAADETAEVVKLKAADEVAETTNEFLDAGEVISKSEETTTGVVAKNEKNALKTGYKRTIAEADVANEAIIKTLADDPATALKNLEPDAVRARAEAIWEKSGPDVAAAVNRRAKKAIADAYGVYIGPDATVLTDPASRFVGRVTSENAAEIIAQESAARNPAIVGKTFRGPRGVGKVDWKVPLGFWVSKALNSWKGGRASKIGEGLMRAAAPRYEPAVQKMMLEQWPAGLSATEGRVAADLFEMQEVRAGLSVEVLRASERTGDSIEFVGRQLNEARRTGDFTKIRSDGVRRAYQRANEFIDNLTQRFIDEGLIPESEVAKFKENMGKYLHTNYANFNVRNWSSVVKDTAVWENAFRLFKKWYPDMTNDQITGHMTWMLNKHRDGVTKVSKGELKFDDLLPGNLPRQILDELKHKKQLPDEIRELYGINKDFVSNFEITTATMIHDLEYTQFLRRVLEEGLETGVFRATPDGAATVQVSGLDRLSNKAIFTHPETAMALGVFDQASKNGSALVNFLAAANGFTKMMKIIPSTSQFRNALSVPFMWMMNGTLASGIGRSSPKVRRILSEANNLFRAKTLEKAANRQGEAMRVLRRAHELNLIGTGAFTGEMQIWHDQFGRLFSGSIENVTKGSKAGEITSKTWNVLRNSYTGVDDYGKFVSWLVHTDRLEKLFAPGGRMSEEAQTALVHLYGSSDIEAAAAEYVKDTFQHFPRTAPLGKIASRNILGGTFVSFPLEMGRNTKNIFAFAAKEAEYALMAPNLSPGFRAMLMRSSIERATQPVAAAIAWNTTNKLMSSDESRDPEFEEAVRSYLVPRWSANSDLIVGGRGEDGTIPVSDAGFNNPYGDILQFYRSAIARPGSLSERFGRVAEELEDLLAGRELFMQAIVNAYTGKIPEEGLISTGIKGDAGERRIGNPLDPDTKWERLYHLLKGISPQLLISAERFAQSLGADRGFGTMPPIKRTYELDQGQEVVAFMGLPRTSNYDPNVAVWFHYKDLMDDVEFIRNGWSADQRQARTPDEMKDSYQKWSKIWDGKNRELVDLVHGSRVLGVEERNIRRYLALNPLARLDKRTQTMINRELMVPFEIAFGFNN